MPADDEFNLLVEQEARIRKVSRMIPIAGDIPETQRHQVIRAAQLFMRDNKLSQSDLADGVGQTATYINNVLSESGSIPPATRDKILRDINNWLEREARAQAARRPSDFVTTRPAERLIDLAEALTAKADMAVAYGPAGIGKSTTVEAIVAEIPTAVAIEAGHDTRTAVKLLEVLWATISRRRRARHAITLEHVADKLRMPERVSTRNLLIIDQAHKLRPPGWVILMELHDKAGCSVLLIGTRDLRDYVNTDDDPEFGQLSSRIGMRVDLAPDLRGSLGRSPRAARKCFTVSDIRKLFHSSKIKLHADVAKMLCDIANTRRGTLRRVVRLQFWAERSAAKAGRDTITVDDVQAANTLVEDEFDLPVVEEFPQVKERTA